MATANLIDHFHDELLFGKIVMVKWWKLLSSEVRYFQGQKFCVVDSTYALGQPEIFENPTRYARSCEYLTYRHHNSLKDLVIIRNTDPGIFLDNILRRCTIMERDLIYPVDTVTKHNPTNIISITNGLITQEIPNE